MRNDVVKLAEIVGQFTYVGSMETHIGEAKEVRGLSCHLDGNTGQVHPHKPGGGQIHGHWNKIHPIPTANFQNARLLHRRRMATMQVRRREKVVDVQLRESVRVITMRVVIRGHGFTGTCSGCTTRLNLQNFPTFQDMGSHS